MRGNRVCALKLNYAITEVMKIKPIDSGQVMRITMPPPQFHLNTNPAPPSNPGLFGEVIFVAEYRNFNGVNQLTWHY
jgi:hypothetical protein